MLALSPLQSEDQIQLQDNRSSNLWVQATKNILRYPSAVIGLIIITVLLLIAVAAPLIATHDPILSMIGVPGETGRLPGKVPCLPLFGCEDAIHLMGLDLNGRDLFSRVIYGARSSLFVGFVSISLAIAAGTILGVTAGYVG